MADAGENEIRKKDREPITMVCFVILVAACIAVLGVYAYQHYVEDHSEYVEYGDTINVDYVGSLYGYYTDNSVVPLIFDTSIESVANNTSNHFTFDYTKKTSFSTSEITIGDSDFLAAIENALIGHKVGETVSVHVDAKDAYPSGNNNVKCTQTTGDYLYFMNNKEMTSSAFNSMYDQTAPSANETLNFEYAGFSITAVGKTNGSVCVTYNVVAGVTKITVPSDVIDTTFGAVTVSIGEIVDSKVYYTISIDNPITISGKTAYGTDVAEIEMISLNLFPDFNMNIVGYDSTGIVYNESTSDESYASTHNMDLYFKVTIVSKE